MNIAKDCVPQNAREWKNFIDQYENAIEYAEGRGEDYTSKDMSESDRLDLVNKYMYLGRGFKKSIFECESDLSDNEKHIFKGVNWRLVKLVKLVWQSRDIDLRSMKLARLPSCPAYVNGQFRCSDNQLTTLDDSPKYVGGNFECKLNLLETLEGAPKIVKGDFVCSRNKLKSLKGAPEYVGVDFWCNNNQLTTLDGVQKTIIEGGFCCTENQLTTLKGGPENVRNAIWCSGNKLPKSIPGRFSGHRLSEYVGVNESHVLKFKQFVK